MLANIGRLSFCVYLLCYDGIKKNYSCYGEIFAFNKSQLAGCGDDVRENIHKGCECSCAFQSESEVSRSITTNRVAMPMQRHTAMVAKSIGSADCINDQARFLVHLAVLQPCLDVSWPPASNTAKKMLKPITDGLLKAKPRRFRLRLMVN